MRTHFQVDDPTGYATTACGLALWSSAGRAADRAKGQELFLRYTLERDQVTCHRCRATQEYNWDFLR